MTLEECISEIVGKLKIGTPFDSHLVLNEMKNNHKYYAIYMDEHAKKYNNCSVAQYHATIAKKIKNASGVEVAPNPQSQSQTVNGDITENTLWVRVK